MSPGGVSQCAVDRATTYQKISSTLVCKLWTTFFVGMGLFKHYFIFLFLFSSHLRILDVCPFYSEGVRLADGTIATPQLPPSPPPNLAWPD